MRLFIALLVVILPGCSVTPPVGNGQGYALISKAHLQKLQDWSLEGRISITSSADSWSANVVWHRNSGADTIALSGPFGQGAVVVSLHENVVSIDRGDGNVRRSEDPDVLVREELGVFVPVRSLAYWVVGLPAPSQSASYSAYGFVQEDWQVEYKEWSLVDGKSMPRKITVSNEKIKLKLVCDQWVIS